MCCITNKSVFVTQYIYKWLLFLFFRLIYIRSNLFSYEFNQFLKTDPLQKIQNPNLDQLYNIESNVER